MIWPLLRTRRWAGFTALVVFVIVAFGILSAWQWNRAEERRQERIALQQALAADPLPLGRALAATPSAWQWTPTRVEGHFDTAHEVVVRKRPLEAQNGFWVMTPFVSDAATVWVNRGWIPAGIDALSTPAVPPPPSGQTTLIGYLQPFEDAAADRNDGLPAGQVAAPAVVLLPEVGATDVGMIQLAESDPAQGDVRTLPLPDIDESRNVSYALQWLAFAAIAMSGWYYFLRREAREDAAPAVVSPDDVPSRVNRS